jgi:hypothetical protein
MLATTCEKFAVGVTWDSRCSRSRRPFTLLVVLDNFETGIADRRAHTLKPMTYLGRGDVLRGEARTPDLLWMSTLFFNL